ncbi:GNAT family N-acetyltransferase [Rhizobium sp. MC63]|uniref:GNAT family N-acetyltransferase n=1 Tax=Rhizobium mulingense TaxID=3031128 RepID=A0ACC6N307_9HYPH|nr:MULTISPECIES: GNAT family N-acetyltransferase [unclassified Rhizobium]MDF0699776.1 GNAT family N-acetyltransferase [Rhizobium sp. MC63]MEA3519979.1 GNAT family N-acetyltransferase [Rhizobium sp. MJ31]MEB3046354.1 GNAT family N-acetyltransferase [Rhizobium sp. MJ21]
MQTRQIEIAAFRPDHLDAALALSRQAGWPHRVEEWQMALSLSEGMVAIEDNRVVGTVLVTPYKQDCATINMVIVDETMRGRGLGRSLMDAALQIAGDRSLRLVATTAGLPLYQKLGFHETGTVLQHQGLARDIPAPAGTDVATADDLRAIMALDRLAFGADREDLLSYLAKVGEFAVIRRDGVSGFACLRAFGRGEVIGPVVAADIEDAMKLIEHHIARRPGHFLRVDTTAKTGLSPWLADHGFVHVGGAIAMIKPSVHHAAARAATTFALASQAFG